MKILILYNKLSENPSSDELDVLHQVAVVEEGLKKNGYLFEKLEFSLDIGGFIDSLNSINPDAVFNLVESVDNNGKLICLAPSILEHYCIPYTGAKHDQMFACQNKLIAKEFMEKNGILTPEYLKKEVGVSENKKQYIVKPIWEDGSLGIEDEKLYTSFSNEIKTYSSDKYFFEEYIDGREFNVSILTGEVLSPAEIIFKDFGNLPKILGYRSKWEMDSFQYQNTFRSFDIEDNIKKKLKEIGRRCWEVFGLSGYARVDFRMNSLGKIYVLEVNPNPCISPDSGFMAAAMQHGYSERDVIKKIIEDIRDDIYA